jgi:methyl-accepting chemotaxis protein
MEQQSEHARNISTTMMQLNADVVETSDSLNESFMAIEQLNEAVHILKNEVSRFKVE